MRAVITGATGLIGRRLAEQLGRENTTVLSRDVSSAKRHVAAARYVAWDGTSPIGPNVFEDVDVVYHLAGEPVASGRWTNEKKRRIRVSRERGTRAVVNAMADAKSRATLVSASAVGYYGSRGDEVLTEESFAGEGFLPDVCKAWETEARAAERSGSRVAMLRIGIVLAREGGALTKMLPVFRTGLAGRLGDGKQWMPWIHIDDVVGLFRHVAEHADIAGPVNAVAPNVVTNTEFTRTLASIVHRPAILAAPSLALRLVLGELSDVVLSSQRVLPASAERHGYAFRFEQLHAALKEAV